MRSRPMARISVFCAALAAAVLFAPRDVAAQSAPCGSLDTCFAQAVEVLRGSATDTAACTVRENGVCASENTRAALALFGTACERGHTQSCYAQGRIILSLGVGDSAQERRAADLFALACEERNQPSAAACNELGEAFYYGLGRPVSLDTAMLYYERGCSRGSATACYRAAARYDEITGLTAAEADSLDKQVSRKACEAGSTNGCINMAVSIENAVLHQPVHEIGVKEYMRQYEFVVNIYRRACTDGDPLGCANLGNILLRDVVGPDGDVLVASAPDSMVYYNRIACRGLTRLAVPAARGCSNLGDRLQDPDSVQTYYALACDLFDVYSCMRLAEHTLQQDSTAFNAAFRLYAMTCFEGYGYGCYRTGLLLENDGDAEDEKQFYQKACDIGYAYGCYLTGFGTSGGASFKYLRRGCDLEEANACIELGDNLSATDWRGATHYYIRACDLARTSVAEWRSRYAATPCAKAAAGLQRQGAEEQAAHYAAQACLYGPASCKKKEP